MRLELSYSLLTLINDRRGYRLTDQIKSLRRQLASEMGFVMPSVRILDNMQLGSTSYVIRVREIESGAGELRPGQLLAMDPRGEAITLPGEETTEPTFGLPAMWIDQSHREEASFRGYTVVDPATVITTHLTEVIKENMSDLLSYAETQKLLDDLPKENQKLIADIIPTQISISGIQRVLQGLLTERISIRNLTTVLEAIGEATGYTQNIAQIIETCTHPHRTANQRFRRRRFWRHPVDQPVAGVGASVCGINCRPGRRAAVVHGPDSIAGIHHPGPSGL